jgi:hypothetical protein
MRSAPFASNRKRLPLTIDHSSRNSRTSIRNTFLPLPTGKGLAQLAWCGQGRAQTNNLAPPSAEEAKQLHEVAFKEISEQARHRVLCPMIPAVAPWGRRI